jgi:type I restriction enzyme, R subunit
MGQRFRMMILKKVAVAGKPGDPPNPPRQGQKIKYQVGRQEFEVARERVSYYGKDGQLTTESLRDYNRRTVQEAYVSLDRFLRRWSEGDRKTAILAELRERGVILEALEEMVGREYDLFDLVCHVAFDQPPLTRRERANQVKKRDVFTQYGDVARSVLEALLEKYADQGVGAIEDTKVLQLEPFVQMGTPVELVRLFGGKAGYQKAVQELARALYEDGAGLTGA